jgi:adenylate cyclase
MSVSIRAKLALLVGLPLLLLAGALPILSSVQHKELIEAADDQVEDAERAFMAEMEDDLADLKLAARIVATHDKTERALRDGSVKEALEVARIFASLYPRLDVTLAKRDGRVLGDVGPTDTPRQLTEMPGLGALDGNAERHTLLAHGCARLETNAPPAQAVLAPVGREGWVLACEPLDQGYLENVSDKLSVELAFIAEQSREISSTVHFPHEISAGANSGLSLVESRGKVWASQRFRLNHRDSYRATPLDVIAAVNVTKTSASVHRHLRIMIGLLMLIAVVAVGFGARVAGVMSSGLMRIISAFQKLARNEYVHVDTIRTKDEIELLAIGFNQMVEGLQERDKLRTTFGKYMTESVLEHLLNGKVELGGETLRVTVLFSDIRSFTTISEAMEAHALVALLNEYFTEMVSIVMNHGGVVDKYIGDAIMAIFGAPVPTEHDATNAVRAAVEMRAALGRLNERLQVRGVQPLRTGIGIHTGDVVAGNIGSEQRMEYTVIGDPVNVASRLESNTKDLGVNVLVSATTYELTKNVIEARPVRELTVKGRAEPIMTYEVLGLRVDQ